jgi:hypothetical protein
VDRTSARYYAQKKWLHFWSHCSKEAIGGTNIAKAPFSL